MKRSLSESDDCDDVFSEESSKEQCSSPGDADSCQMLSRKKRRGIIEKRRRDRINTSLTELRRLVPSAYEKQGSAKLEKAEILQLTVDHLKMLHAKGMDALAYDPHKFAMDYHNIGFRECAAEVARYLVTVEGMDIQDPLRLRLMSHLQCFAAQRELATKQATAAAATPWGSYGVPSGAPPPPGAAAAAAAAAAATSQPFHAPSPAAGGLHPQAPPSGAGDTSGLHPPPPPPLPPAFDAASASQCSNATPPASVASTSAPSQHSQAQSRQGQAASLTPLASPAYPSAQYHMNLNAFPAGPGLSHHHLQQGGAYAGAGASSQRTPYRPWGAELAY